MQGINVLSLFDGKSCGQQALKEANVKVNNYFASEIDKYAIYTANKNFPNTIQLGSILELNTEDLPKIDLLIGGSPYQSFSNAGNGSGFDGKSKLFWEYIRVLKEVKPIYFLLENVVMKKEWENIITNALGVDPIMIDSRVVTAQKRRRLYWSNIPNITQPEDKNIFLKDIMKKEGKFTYPSEKRLAYIQRKIDKGWLKKIYNDVNTEKSECLLASMYKQMQEFIWKGEDGVLRFFSPEECEILQGLPEGYTSGCSTTQRLTMIGNGWTIPVISHIFSFLPIHYFNK